MPKALLLGAGRSVTSLVTYLEKYALHLDLELRIGDIDIKNASRLASLFSGATFFQFDITSNKSLSEEVKAADLVISMLPAHLHGRVAEECLIHKVNLATASYVSPQIKKLDNEAKEKGIVFIMECGLDPGIDHMSAMKELDELRLLKARLISFKSFTGGLIAPESDDNPWNYKFTWNPRNVVLAGQGVAKFKRNNKLKYIPYNSLFKRVETVNVSGLGDLEGYANRDSLSYISTYRLEDCPTVFRGTLRRLGFCRAWDVLVTLGLTNDTFQMFDSKGMTYRQFLNSFLVFHPTKRVEDKIRDLDLDHHVFNKLEWLGLFSEELFVKSENASPAQVLQEILESKWALNSQDKDMVVMQHQLEYELDGKRFFNTSSLVVKGENREMTSMAKTVSLPLGIAIKLLLEDRISLKGVCTPTSPEFYKPILKELKEYGISFKNTKREL